MSRNPPRERFKFGSSKYTVSPYSSRSFRRSAIKSPAIAGPRFSIIAFIIAVYRSYSGMLPKSSRDSSSDVLTCASSRACCTTSR